MSIRVTPTLSDPEKKDRIKVSKYEIDSYLQKKRLPITKKSIRKARAKLRKRKQKQSIPRGREVSASQSDSARQIIYGEMIVGGTLTFINRTASNNWLHLIHSLATHEIEDITGVYLDDNLVTFGLGSTISPSDPRWATGGAAPDGSSVNYNSKVFMDFRAGTDAQAVQSDANTQQPAFWTSTHRQRGVAHAYLILIYDGTLFPDSVPEVSYKVRGKKVYDPRSVTTYYSNNAALCIADFLMNSRFGCGYSLSEINVSSSPGGLAWAANVGDQNVALNAGGTEDRYELNGVFDTDMSKQEILEDMLTAMGGSITFIGGKWHFWPAYYVTPALTLTEDDLRGAVTLETLGSARDRFNVIRGTFVSRENNYEVTDFPTIKIASFVTEDNSIENAEDISLPCTTSSTMAQRLAMIELLDVRESLVFRAPFSAKALNLIPGSGVYLTMSRYGFSSKSFRVLDLEIYRDNSTKELIVDLLLKENSSVIYNWDETVDEQTIKLSPNTELPSPFVVSAPSGLSVESGTDHLLLQSDGTILTRAYLSWTASPDEFVTGGGSYQIQFKKSSASVWANHVIIDGLATEYYLLGVQEGVQYDFRVRAVNPLFAKSAWVQVLNHSVVGKTEPPSNISSFTASVQGGGVLLSWNQISDLDLSHYEIRRGSSWAGASVVVKEFIGNSFFHEFTTTGSHTFLIKAFDTTGNQSAAATPAALTISASTAPQSITSQIIDNNVIIRWAAPSTIVLPIDYYNIYVTSELVGRAYGTFFSYFVILGGSYEIEIEPVDVGGNAGTIGSRTVDLYPPPDYILRESDMLEIDTATTFTNCLESDLVDAFLAPVITSETWQEHFDNNSYSTPQDQIDAGYPIYIQPTTLSDGIFEQEIDLGVAVAGSRINFSWVENLLDGAVTVTPQISYKLNSGDAWTDGASGDSEVFADNFRYIKFKLTIEASDISSLVEISDLQYRVDVKKQTDSGHATSLSSGATNVNFNLSFLDIDSIQVTPAGNASGKYSAVYDFTDVPNPTSFDVFIFNIETGAQVAVDFSWSVEGFVNPT